MASHENIRELKNIKPPILKFFNVSNFLLIRAKAIWEMKREDFNLSFKQKLRNELQNLWRCEKLQTINVNLEFF